MHWGVQEAGSDSFALNWVSLSTRQLKFLGLPTNYLPRYSFERGLSHPATRSKGDAQV